MQPPHLLFNQPRPKRCATHWYIARNINYHQQFTKMNSFWPAAAGSAPLYGSKVCNLSAELQGSVLSTSSNSVPEKSSQSLPNSSDTVQRKQILLQQALSPGAGNNILVSLLCFLLALFLFQVIFSLTLGFDRSFIWFCFIVAWPDIHFPIGPAASCNCCRFCHAS